MEFLVLCQKSMLQRSRVVVTHGLWWDSDVMSSTKKFPLRPAHPERLCWGCDRYCAADALACGNGADRTAHPAELFGEDWYHDTILGSIPEKPQP